MARGPGSRCPTGRSPNVVEKHAWSTQTTVGIIKACRYDRLGPDAGPPAPDKGRRTVTLIFAKATKRPLRTSAARLAGPAPLGPCIMGTH